jgi:CubicO group peptidase (beta-lactamase class C family)
MLISLVISCYASQDQLPQFTSYVKQVQMDWQVPGISIAIVENGKIVYAKGFGKRNANGNPVTPSTIFDIASLTKSFTATLLALQIDQGKYTWSTTVHTLYPPFRLYSSKTTKAFAVRDLMAHNSGLPEDALEGLGDFGYSTQAIMGAVRFVKPVAPFRHVFAYQNVFSNFAEYIIQRASSKNYTKILHQDLLIPLHMDQTYTRIEPILNNLTNVAQPFQYYLGQNYPYPKDSPYLTKMWALKPGLAGGGIHSSVVDLAKWLIFNMNKGFTGDAQIVSKKNMAFIHMPQTIISKAKNGEIELAYGEGWYIDKKAYKPYTVLYHAGGGTGTHSFMAYIPEKKLGIVILTNQWGNKVPEVLYQRFFDLSLKRPLVDWNKIYLEKYRKKTSSQENILLSDPCQHGKKTDLNKYIGTYYNSIYGKLIISADKNNQLALSIGPQHIIWHLAACQKNLLKAYWPNPNHMPIPMLGYGQDLVKFRENTDHKVQSMTIPYLQDSQNFVKTTVGTINL